MELIVSYLMKVFLLPSFSISFIRKNVPNLLALFFMMIPFSGSLFSFNLITFYTDAAGVDTYLSFKSAVLCCVLLVVVIKCGRKGLNGIANIPIYSAFIVMIACAVYTQTINLSLKAGLGLAFIRVVQPFLFVIIVSYVCSSRQGLLTVWWGMILCISFAILLRLISSYEQSSLFDRASFFVSWTLYGAAIASTLPFATVLLITAKRVLSKAILTVYIASAVIEIFFTRTRGAIYSIVLLGLFFMRMNKSFAYLMVVVLPLVIMAYSHFEQMFYISDRIFSINPFEYLQDGNWLGRLDRNTAAVRYIYSHPFTGLGLGAPTSDSGNELAFWVYNPYLHWGVAMGVFCMAAFAAIIFLSLVYAFRNYSAARRDFKIYQLAVLICLLTWVLNQFTTGDSLTYLHSWEWTLFSYLPVGMVLGQKMAMARPAERGGS